MSWYPTDTRPRDPGIALKSFRKMSALVRHGGAELFLAQQFEEMIGDKQTTA